MLDRRTFVFAALASAPAWPAAPQTRGHYQGELLLAPVGTGRLMRVQNDFAYIGPDDQIWEVPGQAVVDGASIPKVFWPVVGGPWEGPYREASVVHDWFCAVRTMPWKQTHRMFYDAMLTSGVPSRKARMMFLAVRYAGPTWDDLTLANSRLLTGNGRRRLDPPGSRRATSGFTTAAEADEAQRVLLSRLEHLTAEADERGMGVTEMEQLVDSNGRAEAVAAMLES